jgi:hypothetical protein
MAQTVLRSLLLEHRRLSNAVNQTTDLGFYELATNEAAFRLHESQGRLAEFRDKFGILAFPGQLGTLLVGHSAWNMPYCSLLDDKAPDVTVTEIVRLGFAVRFPHSPPGHQMPQLEWHNSSQVTH